MERLKIRDNIEYIFDDNAEYKDHHYIAFKKHIKFRKGEKWQVLTIPHENWEEFRKWLQNILDKYQKIEEVPF